MQDSACCPLREDMPKFGTGAPERFPSLVLVVLGILLWAGVSAWVYTIGDRLSQPGNQLARGLCSCRGRPTERLCSLPACPALPKALRLQENPLCPSLHADHGW